MALRDQPYIPLYIQDIMTDEKLNECSASTHGIYIKGIMCLMHKSENYGKILLKQKYKQNESKCLCLAKQLSKHLPYSVDEIELAIEELINEKVCFFDGDYICQKRMIKDNDLSLKRSEAGKKGGTQTHLAKANKLSKTIATNIATTENENENEVINANNKKEEDIEKILSQQIWIEQVAMKYGYKIDDLKESIKTTLEKWSLTGEIYRPESELKKHLVNLINKNKPKEKAKPLNFYE